jgi:cytosine/adenosine deaminase-related metal-dependent hydrolase
LSVGSAADLVVWDQTGPLFAGAHSDPVEAWLRCGPSTARHTVVAGRVLVRGGHPTDPGLTEALTGHARVAKRLQAMS